ncbi:hypothetical protein AB9K26_09840 [Psychroserpens sp. XS_ASV72]|uniref:hypothetical protein n=1 Tax=Psychroserpens sp. XS_ASV72 TaxID=3241293 RepID=UPI003511039D
MIKFTKDILPWSFTILAFSSIFMLYLGYIESKQSNSEIVEVLKRAQIPDTIIINKKLKNDVLNDTILIEKNTVKDNIAELKLISSNTLDDTTMTFLFTFFSVTLLTAGVYLLSTTNKRLNEFEKQHNEMRDESLNLRFSLIMLSTVNNIHSLVTKFDSEDIDFITELREKITTLSSILTSKKFSKLEDQVYNISITKLDFVLETLKDLVEDHYKNNNEKKKTYNTFILNLEKIQQSITNKDKETIIDVRKINN